MLENYHLSERGRQAGERSLQIKPRVARNGLGTPQHVAARETSGRKRSADGCGCARRRAICRRGHRNGRLERVRFVDFGRVYLFFIVDLLSSFNSIG